MAWEWSHTANEAAEIAFRIAADEQRTCELMVDAVKDRFTELYHAITAQESGR